MSSRHFNGGVGVTASKSAATIRRPLQVLVHSALLRAVVKRAPFDANETRAQTQHY
jgi:hypothetical protein